MYVRFTEMILFIFKISKFNTGQLFEFSHDGEACSCIRVMCTDNKIMTELGWIQEWDVYFVMGEYRNRVMSVNSLCMLFFTSAPFWMWALLKWLLT